MISHDFSVFCVKTRGRTEAKSSLGGETYFGVKKKKMNE